MIDNDFRQAAGEFIMRTRTKRHDDIVDLLPDVKNPSVKNWEVWNRIELGDKSVAPSLYVAAIEEVCTLYNLSGARTKTGIRKARTLMANLDRQASAIVPTPQ
jgi:hypothetical protein